jgi:hypothetical protein
MSENYSMLPPPPPLLQLLMQLCLTASSAS